MIRYKGINIEGVEFYHLLNQSKEFTSELGKVILASSRLESQLFIYLKSKGFEINRSKATLGYMINHLETKNLIDDNRIQSLRLVNKQRNYLKIVKLNIIIIFFKENVSIVLLLLVIII